jgi:hypothetical protein
MAVSRFMGRYFFHLHDGADMPDAEGTVLPGPKEAKAQAFATAGEIVRDKTEESLDELRMTVVDEAGQTICTLTFKATC